MSDLAVHRSTEIPFYEGPHAIPGIRFRAARAALGVSAWGMNLLELAPHCSGHPTHDHEQDGQEEVYVVLSGQVELHAGGTTYSLSEGDLVRVPPALSRQLVTQESGAMVLALGGTPGKAYTVTPGM